MESKEQSRVISFTFPLKTISEANTFEYWRKKHERHKMQKHRIHVAFLEHRPQISLPCKIILTRIAPRFLDAEDNLPMALKYCKDVIADIILPGLACGRADGDKRIQWQFAQEKGKPKEYALRIEVFLDNQ